MPKIYDTRTLKERIMYPDRIFRYSGDHKYLGQVDQRFKKTLQHINIDQPSFAKMINHYPLLRDLWVFTSMIQKQMRALYKDESDLPDDLVQLIEVDLELITSYLKQWHPRKMVNCTKCDNGTKNRNKTYCPYCFLGKTGGRLKEYVYNHSDIN